MADCTVWQDVIEFLEAQLDGQGRPWAREAMRQLPHEPPGFATVTEMPELRQVRPLPVPLLSAVAWHLV